MPCSWQDAWGAADKDDGDGLRFTPDELESIKADLERLVAGPPPDAQPDNQ